jgi:hypothetical protein
MVKGDNFSDLIVDTKSRKGPFGKSLTVRIFIYSPKYVFKNGSKYKMTEPPALAPNGLSGNEVNGIYIYIALKTI